MKKLKVCFCSQKTLVVILSLLVLFMTMGGAALAQVTSIGISAPASITDGTTENLIVNIVGTPGQSGWINIWDDDAWFSFGDDFLGSREYTIGNDGRAVVTFPLQAQDCNIVGTGETSAEIFVTADTTTGTVTSNQIKVACDRTVSRIIGTSGGTLVDIAGVITIPQDALATDTNISLVTFPIPAPFATPSGQEIYVARRVEPDGLTFLAGKKATISIPYDHDEDAAALNESSLQAFSFDTSTNHWEPISSTVDRASKRVIIETGHFSIYGIGGEPTPVPASSTWALSPLGIAGLALLLWQKRRREAMPHSNREAVKLGEERI